ncbi:outer membrane beta-barrel protein [Flavobacterium sp.]|uniref:outer membrane beta-barrel protein n=1 Tax=Flavobacterium sp. TaxID=239 RepID=UPI0025B7D786|nr:outer membrane beta-barrel protein [Flavobacterium sp.]
MKSSFNIALKLLFLFYTMFKTLLTALILLSSFAVSAQNQLIFKGKLIDNTSKVPLESATIYLTREKDSAVIEYTISNKKGEFELKVSPQTSPCTLKIAFLKLETFTKRFESIKADFDFGTIALTPKDAQIEEVVINVEAPPIRIKKDTLEFNAASFKLRPDANVESLLKQLPGVEIDADGKITVNGKEVNQILVNGKPFFDKDGKVALQNLPATMINKVQVTDTKTKKEEKTGTNAASNNASINLTIDEKKNKGFFGKAMGGYGTDERYESSGIINYFKNKTKLSVLASANNINSVGFSMDEVFDNMGGGRNGSKLWVNNDGSYWYNGQNFGSSTGITESNLVGINYSDEYFKKMDLSSSFFHSGTNNKNTNKTSRTTLLPTGTFTTNSISSTKTDTQYNNVDFVADVKLDSTFSIVFEPKISQNNRKNYSDSQSTSFENGQLINDFTSKNNAESTNKAIQNTTTLTKAFRKKGRSVSLVLDNENNTNDDNTQTNSQTNFYQNNTPSDIRDQISTSQAKYDNYAASFEYMEPITDSLSIKLGTTLDYKWNKNTNATFDYDPITNAYTSTNDLLTMVYQSKTNEFSTYAGVSMNKNKYNFNIELGTTSITNTNNSEYLGLATRLDKSFMLPKANVYGSYKFNKSESLWVNYYLNYNVPSATQLLPIQNLSNPLNTITGNADLNINKTHSVYLSYRNYDFATRSGYGMWSGINYNESEVTSISVFDENRKRNTTYVNVSGTHNAWLGIYWNKSIKKEKINYRYELRLNNNLTYDKGFVNGQMFTSTSYAITPTARFTYDWTDIITIAPSYNFSKQFINYTNYTIDKTNFYTHKLNLQVTAFWPKKWTFGNDFGYNYNSNLGAGFKKDFYLWNTSLAYSFYKDKFLAKVKVYDLLNQNQSTRRTVTENAITDEENIVLKRYVMFSLTYKIHMFDSKEKKEGRRFMMM